LNLFFMIAVKMCCLLSTSSEERGGITVW
jgi:hypothetical protein